MTCNCNDCACDHQMALRKERIEEEAIMSTDKMRKLAEEVYTCPQCGSHDRNVHYRDCVQEIEAILQAIGDSVRNSSSFADKA